MSRRSESRMDLRIVCYPCYVGEHDYCRGFPDGPRYSKAGSEKGKPCQCEKSGHKLGAGECSQTTAAGGAFDAYRCSKPAKGTWEVGARFGKLGADRTTVVKEMCGVHLAAERRVKANDEARRLKAEAREAERRTNNDALKASEDWAARLRAEFGIDAEALRTDSGRIRVSIPPETVYAALDEMVGLLRDVGITDHPFTPEGTDNG